jgi:GxxExxY protein
METNQITERIIGAAISVHRALGPGLLESTYEACLAFEIRERGLECRRQARIALTYKSVRLRCGYRVDLLVNSAVVVELKAVEKVIPEHVAQLLTYVRLSGCKVGLLLNFNVQQMIQGIQRVIV